MAAAAARACALEPAQLSSAGGATLRARRLQRPAPCSRPVGVWSCGGSVRVLSWASVGRVCVCALPPRWTLAYLQGILRSRWAVHGCRESKRIK